MFRSVCDHVAFEVCYSVFVLHVMPTQLIRFNDKTQPADAFSHQVVCLILGRVHQSTLGIRYSSFALSNDFVLT